MSLTAVAPVTLYTPRNPGWIVAVVRVPNVTLCTNLVTLGILIGDYPTARS